MPLGDGIEVKDEKDLEIPTQKKEKDNNNNNKASSLFLGTWTK